MIKWVLETPKWLLPCMHSWELRDPQRFFLSYKPIMKCKILTRAYLWCIRLLFIIKRMFIFLDQACIYKFEYKPTTDLWSRKIRKKTTLDRTYWRRWQKKIIMRQVIYCQIFWKKLFRIKYQQIYLNVHRE